MASQFSASDEELQLSTRLLETNNWHKTDTLSVDAAIGIFQQSGLTFKQLRDIWTIADKQGSGNLSKHELAVLVRLMGWVQAGKPLDEALLASAGPMPFIKGITESITGSSSRPASNAPIPPINQVDVERFEVAFNGANPVNGILDREKVIVTLFNSNISYNSVQKILDLVDGHQEFDFAQFALASHLGNLLQSSKIASLPSVIPQYLRDQGALLKKPDPPLPPSLQAWVPSTPAASSKFSASSPIASSSSLMPKEPPVESEDQGHLSALQKLESDLLWLRSLIEGNGTVPGQIILKFMTDHKVKPVDFSRIWSSSTFNEDNRLIGAPLDLFLERLKEKVVGQEPSESHSRANDSRSYSVHADDTFSTDPFGSPLHHSPPFPLMKIGPYPSLTSFHLSESDRSYSAFPSNISDIPNLSPSSPTSPAPPADEMFTTDSLQEIQAETAHLLLRVERNFLRHSKQRHQLQFANQTLRDENLALHSKIRDLETKLSESILSSELIRLQDQHMQEIGGLTTDIQQMEGILASLRDQCEAQKTAIHESRDALADSYIEAEQLRESADAQVSVIAELKIQLAKKDEDMANLMNNPDMRLLYLRASLRESQASLAKAQDEIKNLHQVISAQREDVPRLPISSTVEPPPSSVTNDGLLQHLAREHERLSSEMKEMRQMMEEAMSSAQTRSTDPMAPYKYNLSARSSVETIRFDGDSRPHSPTSRRFHKPATSQSQRFTPSLPRIDTNMASIHSFRHISSAAASQVERPPFLVHSPSDDSDESTSSFDAVSAFEQSSQTSQDTSIDAFSYEYTHELPAITPVPSHDMDRVGEAELQEIKADGAKLSLRIERCLKQQRISQINAQAMALTDRSEKEGLRFAYRDFEIRQHQEKLKFLTEKLRDTEAECESLKKPQNSIFGLQNDLADAKKLAEMLQETVDHQQEEITSLKNHCFCLDIVGPPSYEEKPKSSSPSVS